MSTVIDQFIIKVKLDTSEYEAGQKKLSRATKQTKRDVEDAAVGVGSALASMGKNSEKTGSIVSSVMGKGGVIGIAIGSLIYAGKILDDKLFQIARGVRQVGIDSKNFNIAAANLRNLQNASEMAGGSMEDATKTVGGLAGSLYNLKFNGAVDDSLIALSRLGVRFTDSYGRARDFNAVMLDTADAIDKAKAAGRMNDSEAFFFAGQAGFTGGMQNLVTSGRGNVEKELALQLARRQITGATSSASTRLDRSTISLGQGFVAEGGLAGIDKFGNARAGVNETLEGTTKNAVDALGEFADSVEKAAKTLYDFTGGSTIDRARALIEKGKASGPISAVAGDLSVLDGVGKYRGDIAAASKKYGIPAEVLTGMLRTESGFNANASNPSGAKGIAQLMPETGKMLGVTPGQDASADIDAMAHYLSMLRKAGAAGGFEGDMSLAYAVDAYHSGMGNLATGKNLGPESMAYAGKVFAGTSYANVDRPWMPSSSQGTSVSIGDVNVNTQAGDIQGVASDAAAAVKRKIMTAHAERGGQ